jgi:hypothetical protein
MLRAASNAAARSGRLSGAAAQNEEQQEDGNWYSQQPQNNPADFA